MHTRKVHFHYLQSTELSTDLSNDATNINRIKSHENYVGDDAEVFCKASTTEAINGLFCPLILYFKNVNYKTMHITKQDNKSLLHSSNTSLLQAWFLA
jgi:hypothetical protein